MRVGAEVRFPLACILLPKARSDTHYAQDNGKADAHSSDQLHKLYGSRWQDGKRKGECMKGSGENQTAKMLCMLCLLLTCKKLHNRYWFQYAYKPMSVALTSMCTQAVIIKQEAVAS